MRPSRNLALLRASRVRPAAPGSPARREAGTPGRSIRIARRRVESPGGGRISRLIRAHSALRGIGRGFAGFLLRVVNELPLVNGFLLVVDQNPLHFELRRDPRDARAHATPRPAGGLDASLLLEPSQAALTRGGEQSFQELRGGGLPTRRAASRTSANTRSTHVDSRQTGACGRCRSVRISRPCNHRRRILNDRDPPRPEPDGRRRLGRLRSVGAVRIAR